MTPDSPLGCGKDDPREYPTRNSLHLDPWSTSGCSQIATLWNFLGPSIGKSSVHDELLL